MSEVFENTLLNQGSPIRNNRKASNDDIEVEDDEDEISESLSPRSEQSDSSMHEDSFRRKNSRRLSIKHVKVKEIDWNQNDPQMLNVSNTQAQTQTQTSKRLEEFPSSELNIPEPLTPVKGLSRNVSIIKKTTSSTNVVPEAKILCWGENQEAVNIKREISLETAFKKSLQFCIWFQREKGDVTLKPEILDVDKGLNLVGETYISSGKGPYGLDSISPQPIVRLKLFNSRLWRSGKAIGRVKGEVIIQLPPLVKQSLVGILTENGIVKSEHTLIDPNKSTAKNHDRSQELSKTVKTHQDLEQLFNKYFGNLKKGNAGTHALANLEEALINLRDNLDTESIGKYKSMSDLISAQGLYIKIAMYLLEMTSELPDTLKKPVYDIVRILLERRELDLEHLGFESSYDELSPKHMQEKVETGVSYQSLLLSLLKIALEGIRQKGQEIYERTFSEFCLSYCYFRLPPFRNLLSDLLILKTANNSPSPKEDWHKHYDSTPEYYKVQQRTNKQLKMATVIQPTSPMLFDWETVFFKHLQQHPSFNDHLATFQDITADQEWRQNINKRSVGFFYFVVEASRFVNLCIGPQLIESINYFDVPGYDVLMSAFIRELKVREVKAYPDALVVALVQTVESNPKLLTPYFHIIVHKTK